jgi:hypothetical protein
MDSVLSSKKKCWICGTTTNLHKHHIYPGNPNRRLSEKYGCWVYLCGHHHNLSNDGVHFDKEADTKLRIECQAAFKQAFPQLSFLKVFGRNYL